LTFVTADILLFLLLGILLFSLGIRVAQDGTKLLANLVDPLLLGLASLLGILVATLLFYGLNFPLVLLLLTNPEEVFVELNKLFEDCPFPRVIPVVLRHLDDGVDDPHDEIRVVIIFRKYYFAIVLSSAFNVIPQCEVVTDLDAVAEDEVVLFVVDTVNLVDDISHAECAP
jgi:hypothetical protein